MGIKHREIPTGRRWVQKNVIIRPVTRYISQTVQDSAVVIMER